MNENFITSLEVLVIGMGGVFLSLIFFYLLILVLNKIDSIIAKNEKKEIANKVIPTEETSDYSDSDEIDDELLAVISAAAYAVVRKPVRVKTISFLGNREDSTWSQLGKVDVISSHNVAGH